MPRKSALPSPDSQPESQLLQPPDKRASATAKRDAAILNAALEEFTVRGFAAARMEDIARRASVAKGTIYLRFKDKEALFEAIIRQQVSPIVQAVATDVQPGESVRAFLERTIVPFLRDFHRSPRGAVIRLLLAEAGRFPQLAEMYFRTIIEPGMKRIKVLMRQALENGDLPSPELARYPQLLIAPLVVGVIWSGLFDRFDHLNLEAMMRAHLDQLFPGEASVRAGGALRGNRKVQQENL